MLAIAAGLPVSIGGAGLRTARRRREPTGLFDDGTAAAPCSSCTTSSPSAMCATPAGHAYSLRSLASTQEQVTQDALWASLRALQEKEAILQRLAQIQAAQSPGSEREALKEATALAQVNQALAGRF